MVLIIVDIYVRKLVTQIGMVCGGQDGIRTHGGVSPSLP